MHDEASNNMNRRRFLLSCCLTWLAAACSQSTPAPTATSEPTVEKAVSQASEPTPAPTPTAAVLTSTPAPPPPTLDPSKGSVRGVLAVGVGEVKPVAGAILYLAEVLKDEGGNEAAASMDRINSPRTSTNTEGAFLFSNVPPGKYALVLDRVLDSFMLLEPNTGESLIIEVAAGHEVDLGTLEYESLPIPELGG